MVTQLNAIIKNRISTTSEWASNDLVLMQGEIGIERTENEGDKIKIGDGEHTFAELPYFGGDTVDLSAFVTASDPGTPVESPVPDTFGGHTIDEFTLKTDIVNSLTSDATDQPLSAAQGKALNTSISTVSDQVSTLSSQVAQLPTDAEVSAKLDKSGGTMTGQLKAQNNTAYTTGQVRNIFLSTSEPTSSQGGNGDLWFVYEA